MQASENDTIAAIATPPGRGGIGIVRISGPAVSQIAERILGRLPVPRRARFGPFLGLDGVAVDEGIALYFPAPQSFTGEDVLELHGHGGPVVMDLLLTQVLGYGARTAGPGEFSARAFLNGRLDLAQAEAIADLIDSGTAAAARAALRSLQGEFSLRVTSLVEGVTELRAWVEAAIDFPEEEIDFLADEALRDRLAGLVAQLQELLGTAARGRLLQEGLKLVIAGRPNAGKSSLLNRLAGQEAAIVTPLPGTTRDVLRERIDLDGLPLLIVDTAGLHQEAGLVEREGIRRARAELAEADHVLLVVDVAAADAAVTESALLAELPAGQPATVLLNKIDLIGRTAAFEPGPPPRLALSALTGEGMERLREHLKEIAGYAPDGGSLLSARRRHLDALERAARHLAEAGRQLCEARAGELVAEELRDVQNALGEITGEVTSEDLLGRIFSSFCIGK